MNAIVAPMSDRFENQVLRELTVNGLVEGQH
jgi:hypothetical protein